MSYLKLEFPLLVEPVEREGYRLQPLLFPGVSATHKRYAKAVEAFRKTLHRQQFKKFRVERGNMTELLWHTFYPQLRFERKLFELRIGKRWLRGSLALAFYALNDADYACFPKLDHLTVMLNTDTSERETQLFNAVQGFFRALPKNDSIDPEPYLSTSNETTARFHTHLALQTAKFPFEYSDDSFFALSGPHSSLRGADELQRVGYDLNERYPDELGEPYLRTNLAAEIKDTIYQSQATAIALVGPRGCGKTTLIEGAVKQFMRSSDLQQQHKLPKVWYLDPLRVISGMSVIGMWQRRMDVIIHYLRHRLRDSFRIRKTDHLYIDNVVALFRIGKSAHNSLTLADVLKPYLEKRAFTMIVEATPEAWQKAQQFDRKFADLFEVIRVDEPNPETAVKMLTWQRIQLEHSHECRFSSNALTALWDLRAQTAGAEVLPGAVTRVMQQLASRYREADIDQKAVYADYQTSHKFRQIIFDPEQVLPDEQVRSYLDQRLIGQQRAKQSLANTVHIVKARLADPEKPLAALLFIGPTGVGKTEAVKVLADYLFTDPQHLVRFDMNEYVDADAASRLIGDFNQPQGQLTTQVRHRRACVVLLDEIEKAHPQVHDLLLQVLGEGRLTDALGRTTDFSQCVIVMTSNLGATEALRGAGFVHHAADTAHTYVQAVERFFRPEFLNRIDEQVVFEPLALNEAVAITRLQIQRLLMRDGFVRRTTFFSVTPATLEQVAGTGFDPQLGGRALKRNIERSLTMLSASELVRVLPDRPLLLEVYSDNGRLHSHIVALDYDSPQHASVPNTAAEQLPTAFTELAALVATLETQLNEHIDQASAEQRIELWTLKERLIELKRVVMDVCWDIENWQRNRQRTPFQLKRRSRLNQDWRRSRTTSLRDLQAQQVLVDYLRDRYAEAEVLHENTTPFYLQQCLQLQFIQTVLTAIAAGHPQRFALGIASCVEGQGKSEQKYLAEQYQQLLQALDVTSVEVKRQGSQTFVLVSGYGVYALLEREAGVHLFQDRSQPSVPLRVVVNEIAAQESEAAFLQNANANTANLAPPQRPHPGKITRIYNLQGQPLITDLGCGLMCAQALSSVDWQLLLFSRLGSSGPAM